MDDKKRKLFLKITAGVMAVVSLLTVFVGVFPAQF